MCVPGTSSPRDLVVNVSLYGSSTRFLLEENKGLYMDRTPVDLRGFIGTPSVPSSLDFSFS